MTEVSPARGVGEAAGDVLRGRVAVISGGSRGIGRAIANRYVAAGAQVVIAARQKAALATAVAELNAGGERCLGVEADVADARAIGEVVEAALAWAGGVDILVNNAGGAPAGRLLDLSDEQFLSAWGLKLLGAIRLMRLLIPVMRERGGGAIINVIGLGGREPKPESIAIATTNAAIRALVKGTAPELATYGITINAISPTRVRTERAVTLTRQVAESRGVPFEEVEAEVLKTIPTGRLVEPAEIAEIALLLASGLVPSLTGSEIVVDGGASHAL